MNKSEIAQLLLDEALTMTFTPAIGVYDVMQQTDAIEAQHIEVQFLPNESTELSVGNDAPKWHQGFLQMTVVWPTGQGVVAPALYVDQIIDHWRKGTTLFGTGFKLKVNRTPWDGQPFKDGKWVRIPVSIPYIDIA